MTLKFVLAFTLSALASQAALGATISGRLVAGGGIDYMTISIKDGSGKTVQAFCTDKCGDWFEEDKDEVSSLRKEFVGKKATMTYQSETNNKRLESFGETGEKLIFVKKIALIK